MRSSSAPACTTSCGSRGAAYPTSCRRSRSTGALPGRCRQRRKQIERRYPRRLTMYLDLVPIWTVILALSVFMYVLLDGFDLGVGMLFPFAPDDAGRDTMMASVAPVWDGNETWLVMGGIGLLTAFPLAFAIIIPALYFPVLAMLLGLIFRGVSFEFRAIARTSRKRWDAAFFWGSLFATFAQGCVL